MFNSEQFMSVSAFNVIKIMSLHLVMTGPSVTMRTLHVFVYLAYFVMSIHNLHWLREMDK